MDLTFYLCCWKFLFYSKNIVCIETSLLIGVGSSFFETMKTNCRLKLIIKELINLKLINEDKRYN